MACSYWLSACHASGLSATPATVLAGKEEFAVFGHWPEFVIYHHFEGVGGVANGIKQRFYTVAIGFCLLLSVGDGLCGFLLCEEEVYCSLDDGDVLSI